LEKVASGFETGLQLLIAGTQRNQSSPSESRALAEELNVAEAAAIHFKSAANQARFNGDRERLAKAGDRAQAMPLLVSLEATLRDELRLARRLFEIQSRDARIGFEASNHYFYVPIDLMEKVVNCRDLLDRWLREEKERRGILPPPGG
jgi:hypothetical protein